MPRLLHLLTLLAGLSAAGLAIMYARLSGAHGALRSQLDDLESRSTRLESKADALTAKLAVTESERETAKAKLTAAETSSTRLAQELAQTKATLAERETYIRGLGDQVGGLQRDLESASANAVPPETVVAYKNTIAELERQLAEAKNGAAVINTPGAATAVFTSRGGRRYPVVTVGPQSAFVVLAYGSDRGAQVGTTLRVSRGTEPIANVLISDVRSQFCIAQVEPDSLHGALQKGDLASITQTP